MYFDVTREVGSLGSDLARPDVWPRPVQLSTMDRELANPCRELIHVERGRGRRYPAALRDRVARWTRARRGGGAGWLDIAAELEIGGETLKRWTTTGDAAETALVPVEVVTDMPPVGPLAILPFGLRPACCGSPPTLGLHADHHTSTTSTAPPRMRASLPLRYPALSSASTVSGSRLSTE